MLEKLINDAKNVAEGEHFTRLKKIDEIIKHPDFKQQNEQGQAEIHLYHAQTAQQVARRIGNSSYPSYLEHNRISATSFDNAWNLVAKNPQLAQLKRTIFAKVVQAYLNETEFALTQKLYSTAESSWKKSQDWFQKLPEAEIDLQSELRDLKKAFLTTEVKMLQSQASSALASEQFANTCSHYARATEVQVKLCKYIKQYYPAESVAGHLEKLAELYYRSAKTYELGKDKSAAISNFEKALEVYNELSSDPQYQKNLANDISCIKRSLNTLAPQKHSARKFTKSSNHNSKGANMNDKETVEQKIDMKIIKSLNDYIKQDSQIMILMVEPYEQTLEARKRTQEEITSYLKKELTANSGNYVQIMSDDIMVSGKCINTLITKFSDKLVAKASNNQSQNTSPHTTTKPSSNGHTNGFLNQKLAISSPKSNSHSTTSESQSTSYSVSNTKNNNKNETNLENMDLHLLRKLVSDTEKERDSSKKERDSLKRKLDDLKKEQSLQEELVTYILKKQKSNTELDQTLENINAKIFKR